jgi:hypothetical protein
MANADLWFAFAFPGLSSTSRIVASVARDWAQRTNPPQFRQPQTIPLP